MPNTTVVAVWLRRTGENSQALRWMSPSWPAICGMAVDTIVASMAIMNIAAITEARTSGRLVRDLSDMGPF